MFDECRAAFRQTSSAAALFRKRIGHIGRYPRDAHRTRACAAFLASSRRLFRTRGRCEPCGWSVHPRHLRRIRVSVDDFVVRDSSSLQAGMGFHGSEQHYVHVAAKNVFQE